MESNPAGPIHGPTRAQIAADWDLWRDYVDTYGVMTREEFDAMDQAERIDLIEQVFGPEGA